MADATVKLGVQYRSIAIERAMIDEEKRTVDLSFSSEARVPRYWGLEVLDHGESAVRLDRLRAAAPLLMDHSMRDQVGVVDSVSIGPDRKGRAVVRFGKSARAEEVFRDVLDGIRANVSVGYLVHDAIEAGVENDRPVVRVTDWEPYEISIVSVPADTTVGPGRSDLPPPRDIIIRKETPIMENIAPAVAVDAEKIRAEERRRHTELRAIAQQAKVDVTKADEAIASGMTIEQFRTECFNTVLARQTNPPATLDMPKKEAQAYSLRRALLAGSSGDWKDAGLELEAHTAIQKRLGFSPRMENGFFVPNDVQTLRRDFVNMEAVRSMLAQYGRRDLTVGTATAGGNTVATNLLASSLIELLRNRSVLMQLGARMLSGLVGSVAIPKQSGAATGYWLTNEATAITESQQTIAQVTMAPKTVGCYTEFSRQLLLQSSLDVEQFITDDFARVIGLAIDVAGLRGAGSGGEPLGITGTAGIGAVTGTSLAWAGIVECQTDVGTANALTNDCAYLTTPAVAGLLMQRQRFASTDSPIWMGSLLDGLVAGLRAAASAQMAAATMLFGDFTQVIVGEWGTFEIATNPYANFAAGITGVRGMQSVDIGIRQAGAFTYSSSIT
jgi:HK97 family phage major capsid protein